ncbi:hypothetical protein V865_002705 [Kwoniella europaea PYCC6329]|uniref:Homeobox domain-containing protein n=1 Tax=Kwoniella europaea PYCC6329 TaxID=1423913 RepID=A0AAX4KF03_9TREE
MDRVTALQEIISVANQIRKTCGDVQQRPPLLVSGLRPQFVLPSRAWMFNTNIPWPVFPQLDLIWNRIIGHLNQEIGRRIDQFENALSNMVSLEQAGGMEDREVEFQLCAVFESSFETHCNEIRRIVNNSFQQLPFQGSDSSSRNTAFSQTTIKLLEAAYTRTKILSAAETAIIAEAAGITPHQVRTWFQNKRNRGSKRAPSSSANRPIQSLPKRAQQIKLETSPFSSSPAPIKRQVRGLPKRAQAQVSHYAPNSSILDSSLGDLPFSEESFSLGHGEPPHRGKGNGERMNRSPSLTSTISNSSEIPNGGFISPFDAQNITQIAIEWGTGTLNVPVDVLEGGKLPMFNFTPPSPLNLNFNPMFNPSPNSSNNDMASMFGGQVFDTPTSNIATFDPSAQQPNLDLAAGLESIESLLSSALSDPSSFEQFSTLAASPQISLGSLSPRTDTLESIPSIASAFGSNIGLAGNGEEVLDGGFFEALEGLLASQNIGEGGLGSPFSESVYGGNTARKALTSSQASGIISAEEGIDLSYIAGIPLPPSPIRGSFDLLEFDNMAGPSFSHDEQTSSINDNISSSFTENDFLVQPHSGMCTPSSITSVYPLITPTNPSGLNREPLLEIEHDQWNWMSGVLPFDMVGMEVDMMEFGNVTKVDGEQGWMMGSNDEEGMMAL